MTDPLLMTTPMYLKPRINRAFERYDYKLGCLAVRKDSAWWISIPNGQGIRCSSEEEARNGAQFINLTADDERETWR